MNPPTLSFLSSTKDRNVSTSDDKITRLGKRKHADMAKNRRFRRVDFYKPDQEEDEKGAITFGLALIISSDTTTDTDASCAAYASAIGVILPDFVDNLKEIMHRRGIKTVDVFIPSQAAALKSIQIPTGSPGWNDMVVLFGVGLLLLFKDFNSTSFRKFMAARLKALKSIVGSLDDAPNLFTLKQAENVRRVFGSDRKLKKRLVETFISYSARGDKMGGCCRYLMHILEWSGMQVFKCVYDNIFASKSFVVDDPKLEGEVVVAREAIDKVMKLSCPGLFRFLAPAEEQNLLDSSRFPTLTTLAAAIMMDSGGSVFFSTPIDVNNPEIKRLLKIHRRSMRIPVKTTHIHQFLTRNRCFKS